MKEKSLGSVSENVAIGLPKSLLNWNGTSSQKSKSWFCCFSSCFAAVEINLGILVRLVIHTVEKKGRLRPETRTIALAKGSWNFLNGFPVAMTTRFHFKQTSELITQDLERISTYGDIKLYINCICWIYPPPRNSDKGNFIGIPY